MLNFDENHGQVNLESLKKVLTEALKITTAALGITITISGLVIGFKKITLNDCDIVDEHIHLYTSDKGLSVYKMGEWKKSNGYHITDNYVLLNDNNKEYYQLISDNGLINYHENKEAIDEIVADQKDYTEYGYIYFDKVETKSYWVEKTDWEKTFSLFDYKKITTEAGGGAHFNWTTDSTHDFLTGQTRVQHYYYVGYKIVKDENANYKLLESEEVSDLKEIVDEYPFLKSLNNTKVIEGMAPTSYQNIVGANEKPKIKTRSLLL